MTVPTGDKKSTYIPGHGLPLGCPFGVGSAAPSPQVSDELGALGAPNTSTLPASEASKPKRLGKRVLAKLASDLTARELEVLARIAEHRFLTTHQVKAFCFRSHATDDSAARSTRRQLARLRDAGLLRALDRRIGGVRYGSGATVWQLTPGGQRLLRREGLRHGSTNPSERFLAHCLAVADVHVLLEQHRRIEAISDIVVEVEPASWRRYQGLSGETRWLQPDLYAEISAGAFLDRLFIEVDRGTESVPTLLGKCEQYELYHRSGVEQQRYTTFPLVLWLLTSDSRIRALETVIRRRPGLTTAMYRFATPETLTQVLAGGSV